MSGRGVVMIEDPTRRGSYLTLDSGCVPPSYSPPSKDGRRIYGMRDESIHNRNRIYQLTPVDRKIMQAAYIGSERFNTPDFNASARMRSPSLELKMESITGVKPSAVFYLFAGFVPDFMREAGIIKDLSEVMFMFDDTKQKPSLDGLIGMPVLSYESPFGRGALIHGISLNHRTLDELRKTEFFEIDLSR